MELPSVMRAVVWDGSLRMDDTVPVPEWRPGWAIIRVIRVGICGTDRALTRGYKGFTGIPGHEMVGIVVACDRDEWIHRTVTADINVGCGDCGRCHAGDARHCVDRRALGIIDIDGAMADYCTLPVENLVAVTDVPVDKAVFAEPLAAACRVLDAVAVTESTRAIVLGDGPLGILCAWVLTTRSLDVTLVGHHAHKLEKARWRHLKTDLRTSGYDTAATEDRFAGEGVAARDRKSLRPDITATGGDGLSRGPDADVVVDATGSARGVVEAMALCRPRGTVVVKTTQSNYVPIPLATLVVNEIRLVGSRCGKIADAVKWIRDFPDAPLERLITHRFALDQAWEAFAAAAGHEAIKVILAP